MGENNNGETLNRMFWDIAIWNFANTLTCNNQQTNYGDKLNDKAIQKIKNSKTHWLKKSEKTENPFTHSPYISNYYRI